MIWSAILIALREIRRSPMRSILTTLGIVIGVASVIAIVTLGRGVTAKVRADVASMGNNLLIVAPGAERRGPAAADAPPFKPEDARAIVREVKAAAHVAPFGQRAILAVAGNRNWNTLATGTTSDYFPARGFTLELGEVFTEAQMQAGMAVCVLGATVRKELFGPQDPLGSIVRVGPVPCTVVGVASEKGKSTFGADQDDFVAIPLATFHRRISGNQDVTAIFVAATEEDKITKAKNQIQALFHERRRVALGQADTFRVDDMREISNILGNVTGALTVLLSCVAAVSLLVGGIGIMNIMLVSVTERTREIGIRLSIGAREREVLLQFLVEAVTLCAFGGALGIGLGLAASFAAARAFTIPFAPGPDVVLLAFAFSGAVGIVFGYLPARRASRLNPIDALRHE